MNNICAVFTWVANHALEIHINNVLLHSKNSHSTLISSTVMAQGIKRKPEQLPKTPDPRTIIVTNVVSDTLSTEDASWKSNKMDQKQGSVSDMTNWCANGSKMNNNNVSTKDSVCGKEIVQSTAVTGDGGAHTNNPMPENIQYNKYNPPPNMDTTITDNGIMVTLKQRVKNFLVQEWQILYFQPSRCLQYQPRYYAW